MAQPPFFVGSDRRGARSDATAFLGCDAAHRTLRMDVASGRDPGAAAHPREAWPRHRALRLRLKSTSQVEVLDLPTRKWGELGSLETRRPGTFVKRCVAVTVRSHDQLLTGTIRLIQDFFVERLMTFRLHRRTAAFKSGCRNHPTFGEDQFESLVGEVEGDAIAQSRGNVACKVLANLNNLAIQDLVADEHWLFSDP